MSRGFSEGKQNDNSSQRQEIMVELFMLSKQGDNLTV